MTPATGDRGSAPDFEVVAARIRAVESAIRELRVRWLAIFGPTVRRQARSPSDVDVLVEFEPGGKNLHRFLRLGELLEQAVGRPIDLVTTEGLSPVLPLRGALRAHTRSLETGRLILAKAHEPIAIRIGPFIGPHVLPQATDVIRAA